MYCTSDECEARKSRAKVKVAADINLFLSKRARRPPVLTSPPTENSTYTFTAEGFEICKSAALSLLNPVPGRN
jgi:hypothetical protein